MAKRMSRAVQERRAPKEVEQDTPERRRWRALDYFGTPPWACRAGAELIKRIDPMADTIWEPACADGVMAECLKETFKTVFASDIWPQGYGAKIDFLAERSQPVNCDWVVTNPPYTLAMEFLRRGLDVARSGVALLCRLAILETEARYEQLYRSEHPLTVLAPFSERVPMQLGPWDPKCDTATAYAWFLFLKTASGEMKWAARLHPIPPGTRDRLWRKDDVKRFCRIATAAPLLEGVDGRSVDTGTT